MSIIVGRLPGNIAGRDIIIGDLHGHPEILHRILERAEFDPSRDRVISTGDLIDRGPNSLGCLELLNEPWFFAVRGNHEQHLAAIITAVSDGLNYGQSIARATAHISNTVTRMGTEWFPQWLAGPSFDRQHMNAICARILTLPHILVIGDGLQRFNVVHADLLDAGLASDDRIDAAHGLQNDHCEQTLLWSRTAYRCLQDGYDAPDLEQRLSLTFCGHNATPLPMAWGQHMFIDTGCGYLANPDYGLSAVIIPGGDILFEPMPPVIWGLETADRRRILVGDKIERISP